MRQYTVVAFGEVLWDLLPGGSILGGAPFNFVYRINSLGHRGLMISRLGEDELGRRALERIRELGMETAYLQADRERTTGTVEVRFDAQKNPDYTIISNAAYDFIVSRPELLELVGRADCICFGTLAQRGETSRRTLQALLAAFGGRFALLDINLRRGCYTRESIRSSIERADILKLNDEEAAVAAEACGVPETSLPELAGALIDRTGLQYLVVTLGPAGAFAVSRQGERVYEPGFQVRLADPLGAGDAFSAGFVASLLASRPLREACRFGNALGALVAGYPGATHPVERREIEETMRNGRRSPPDPRLSEYRRE